MEWLLSHSDAFAPSLFASQIEERGAKLKFLATLFRRVYELKEVGRICVRENYRLKYVFFEKDELQVIKPLSRPLLRV